MKELGLRCAQTKEFKQCRRRNFSSELCREAILFTTALCVTGVMKTSHGNNLHLGGTRCCACLNSFPCVKHWSCTAIKGEKCCDGSYFIFMILVLANFDVILTQARITGDEGTSTEKIHIEHFL